MRRRMIFVIISSNTSTFSFARVNRNGPTFLFLVNLSYHIDYLLMDHIKHPTINFDNPYIDLDP